MYNNGRVSYHNIIRKWYNGQAVKVISTIIIYKA